MAREKRKRAIQYSVVTPVKALNLCSGSSAGVTGSPACAGDDTGEIARATLHLLPSAAAPHALLQKLEVVPDVRVGRVKRERFSELLVRARVVAAQHVGEALVVQDLGRGPQNGDRRVIGAVRQLEALEAVVRGAEADERLRLALRRHVLLLGHASEVQLGEAVVLLVIVALAEREIIERVF